MIEILGLPFSAHTRKVLLALYEKDIPHTLVSVLPLTPPPGWLEQSPLGKIPVLRTPELTVADSSVICQYLERIHPEPALYPSDPVEFARVLWLEEFVDGGLAPHVLYGLLMQRVFAPRFLNRAPDEALIRRSLEQELPPRFAYLEQSVNGDYLVGTSLSVADITVASMLINFHYAGERLGRQYPRLERYLRTLLRRPSFQRAFQLELPAARQIEGMDPALLQESMA